MCSISGVSVAPGSTLNIHKLANALLEAGEVRGRDASGYAYVSPGGSGMYKKDLPGGKLHVGKIPTSTTSLILHTRQGTHGSPKDNENNHPVVSPSGRIRLVHNGVIYNHEDIRGMLGKIGKGLPDVDSSVIPALIEVYGLDTTSELAGYAACAWLDEETDDTIHLARFDSAPVNFAQLRDGSLVFASTPDILGRALNKAKLEWIGMYPGPFETMREGEYFQIMGGQIIAESEVDWKTEYEYAGRNWRSVTSGTSSVYGNSTVSKTPTTVNPVAGSEDLGTPLALSNELDDEPIEGEVLPFPSAKTGAQGSAEARFYDGAISEEEYDRWVWEGDPANKVDPDMPDLMDVMSTNGYNPVFYLLGHDGDYLTFETLAGIRERLLWDAGLGVGENHLVGPDEGSLRWVNHYADLGVLSEDEKEQYSWVKDDGNFQLFEPLLPSWVGDGISKLRNLVGA